MKSRTISKRIDTIDQLPRGRVNLDRLRNMSEEEIERTSPPELRNLPADFWDSAVMMPPIIKTPVSIRIDADVLSWYRKQGPRYQTRMNAVLRAYMNAAPPKRKRKRSA